MAAYKDTERGTWYVSFHYYDWTGKNKRKLKREFKTRKEALEWEQHFRMKEAADLDMSFEDFVQAYTMIIIRSMIYQDQVEVTQVMNELTYRHFIEDKAILLGKSLQVYAEIHLWMRVFRNLEIYYLK